MTSDYELKIINKPMYYIEMVALVNRLALDRSFTGIQLTAMQNESLDIIKAFRLKGFELFELYLINEKLDSIDTIAELLTSVEPIDFLNRIFDEELYKQSSLSTGSLRYVFEHTREFMAALIEIFRLIDSTAREQLSRQRIYEESISKVSQDLKSKVPLEVAQDIMGKKFKRVSDYRNYYFVPSYFYLNRPMRTFDEKTQIVVYPVKLTDSYSKEALANALRVIGDSTRLDIIELLAKNPMFGKELSGRLGIVTSTVSHHLEQLRSIGLLHEERVKSVKYFSINRNEYKRLCEALKQFIAEE